MWGSVCSDRVSYWIPGRLELMHPVFQVFMFRVLVCGLIKFGLLGVGWWVFVWLVVGWYPLTFWEHLIISWTNFCGR